MNSEVPEQERQWAMYLHLSQLANFLIPFAGLIAPLVIWQTKKDEMPSIDEHGKVVANWIISSLIYGVVCFILVFILIGIPMLFVLGIMNIGFAIYGGIKANEGVLWPYPLTIPFIK